jgi:uncharacterized membrane protein
MQLDINLFYFNILYAFTYNLLYLFKINAKAYSYDNTRQFC